MSPKTLLRLLLALGLALAAWGAAALVSHERADRPTALRVPAVPITEVDRITMARPSDTVVVHKEAGGKWSVNGDPASNATVEDFLSALADTSSSSELIARTSASHTRVGLDSAAAKRLQIEGGGKSLYELWLGNRGPDFEGYYVRQPPDSAVYLDHRRLPGLADRRASDWRDRNIALVARDSITAIEAARGSERWAVRKTDGEWHLDGGGSPDSAAIDHLLSAVTDLEATGFPDRQEADSARFDRPARRLTLRGPSGASLVSLVLDSVYGGFLVRQDSGGPLYRIDAGKAEKWIPHKAALTP